MNVATIVEAPWWYFLKLMHKKHPAIARHDLRVVKGFETTSEQSLSEV
jgi:hypothetical protein